MNQIANMNAVQTMTSREIAELTGSRHDKVKQSIERLSTPPKNDPDQKPAIVRPPMGVEHSVDAVGRPRETQIYVFSGDQGRLDSITVVAQLCPTFTSVLVRRWDELERQVAKPSLPDFSNPVAAARAWADAQEQLQLKAKREAALQAHIEEVKPDLEYLDTITHHTGSMSVADAAKSIGTGERRLYEFMRQNGWVKKDNTPYQERIDLGHLDITRSRYDNGKGELRDKYTTRVTEKGKNLLYKRIREMAPSIINASVYAAAKEGK